MGLTRQLVVLVKLFCLADVFKDWLKEQCDATDKTKAKENSKSEKEIIMRSLSDDCLQHSISDVSAALCVRTLDTCAKLVPGSTVCN